MGPVPPPAGIVTAVRTARMAVAIVVIVDANVIVTEESTVVAAVVVIDRTPVVGGGVGVVDTGAEKGGTEQREEQRKGAFHGSWTGSIHTLFGESRVRQPGRRGHVENGIPLLRSVEKPMFRRIPEFRHNSGVIRSLGSWFVELRIQCGYKSLRWPWKLLWLGAETREEIDSCAREPTTTNFTPASSAAEGRLHLG